MNSCSCSLRLSSAGITGMCHQSRPAAPSDLPIPEDGGGRRWDHQGDPADSRAHLTAERLLSGVLQRVNLERHAALEGLPTGLTGEGHVLGVGCGWAPAVTSPGYLPEPPLPDLSSGSPAPHSFLGGGTELNGIPRVKASSLGPVTWKANEEHIWRQPSLLRDHQPVTQHAPGQDLDPRVSVPSSLHCPVKKCLPGHLSI